MSVNVNPEKNCCTMCDLDIVDNVWFQPGPPGFLGKCKLDELTFGQVYMVLQRNPNAKADLLRVSSNRALRILASQSQLITDPLDDDRNAQKRIDANSLPFYTQMRGNIDGSIR